MSIDELIQIYKVTINKNNKQILWDKIVMKLTEGNFQSWDHHLCENLKEIADQIYEKNVIIFFQRLFQSTSINEETITNNQSDQRLCLRNQGNAKLIFKNTEEWVLITKLMFRFFGE